MKTSFGFLAVMGVLLLGAGCASTPARRISREPQLFAAFAPEQQAKIRQGEIEIGFSRDMVRLALGAPQQVHTRTTEAGEAEVWTYLNARYISNYQPMHSGYWYRDHGGRLRHSYETVWVDRGWYEEYPVTRLEFVADHLKAIERMNLKKSDRF